MPPQASTQRSVLLIDDDHYVLDFYADAFRNAGYDTDIAVGAADALRKLKSEKNYRAVIFDIAMVAVDGFELLDMIRKDNLAKNSVFIILTNVTDPDKIQKAKDLGINTYMIKVSTIPVEAVKRVNQVLEEKIQI
jgi:CheY-like chemotaxis protein